MGAVRETPEIDVKPPLGTPLLIFPRGYLLKSFPQRDTSARQSGYGISVFPLLSELPKAMEPHQPVCQLYCWQLGPNMWFSSMTKSLEPIVVTALWMDFPEEFARNYLMLEAWTTKVTGHGSLDSKIEAT